MIIDDTINQFIDTYLINEQLGRDHKSSGKLSAGMLGWPTQWQILKHLQHPEKTLDPYLLRKFRRGNDVETFIINRLTENKAVYDTQCFTEYKKVIGYADCIVYTKDLQLKSDAEYIPIEIKSVTNAKYRRLLRGDGADKQHQLQAGLYALGLGMNEYGICYVASDDYRTLTLIDKTSKIKSEIDEIIAKYNKCLKARIVPIFEPFLSWHDKKDYNPYPNMIDAPEMTFEEYEAIKGN